MKIKLNIMVGLLSFFACSAYGMQGKPSDAKPQHGKTDRIPITVGVRMPDSTYLQLVLGYFVPGQKNTIVSGSSFYKALAKVRPGQQFIIQIDKSVMDIAEPITMNSQFTLDEIRNAVDFAAWPGMPQ